jgi:hypothetical protein
VRRHDGRPLSRDAIPPTDAGHATTGTSALPLTAVTGATTAEGANAGLPETALSDQSTDDSEGEHGALPDQENISAGQDLEELALNSLHSEDSDDDLRILSVNRDKSGDELGYTLDIQSSNLLSHDSDLSRSDLIDVHKGSSQSILERVHAINSSQPNIDYHKGTSQSSFDRVDALNSNVNIMHDANLYSTAVSRTDRQSNVLSPTNQALIDSNDTNANRLSIDSNLLSNASQRDILRGNNPAVYSSTNTVSSTSTANDPISRASGRQAAIDTQT